MGKIGKLFAFLTVVSAIGAGVYGYFHPEFLPLLLSIRIPSCIFQFLAVVMIAYSAYNYYLLGWQEAKPNEWLIIIQNGQEVKSGIGLICFKWFYQTVAKFSSSVQEVNFKAMQVCDEMQGLQISGFTMWQVLRQSPFMYYKQMYGINSNQQIQKVCESIVRHEIANSNIHTVMTQREALRDKMKEQLQKIMSGWGIWIDTVEITEVKICSKNLFEDMQAPSKQENYLKSQKCRLKTNHQIGINEKRSNFENNKKVYRQNNENEKFNLKEEIKMMEQKALYNEQNFKFKQKEIERKQEIALENLKTRFSVVIENLKKQLENKKLEQDQSRTVYKQNITDVQELSDLNYRLQVYEKKIQLMKYVKLSNISLNSYQKETNTDLGNNIPIIKFDLPVQSFVE